jgi:hypothetical protein
VENLQHCCTTNITFTTASEDVLKHGVDTSAMKSRNKELAWEIRKTHKEFYLGNLKGEDRAGELSVDRKIM